MKDEAGDIVQSMHNTANEAGGCISLLQTAFIYNSSKNLHDCRMKVDAVKCTGLQLIDRVSGLARKDPALKPYASVPLHLAGIGESLDKLSELVGRTISEGLLFSDRAVTEMTYLLQRLIDILKPMADIILSKDEIQSRYILESEAGIERRAIEYATLHEERLIEGLCLAVSAPVYINMLDAIKNIAWHTKEIAAKVVQ